LLPPLNRRRVLILVALLGPVGLLFLFPGQRLWFAFTLATGIGTASLQERIDALEEKAIRGVEFSAEEREFLTDFYRTLATGAKLSLLVRQTGRMMDHYLDGSGAEHRLDAGIFTENVKVRAQMAALRRRAVSAPCTSEKRFSSPSFYMPDASKLDSVFGLYDGTVHVTRSPSAGGGCVLRWRAEVPWIWPSYPRLKKEYGNYHAESFPLPTLRSIVFGRRHALFVDNGLGEYLVQLGLARPFLAFAEWDES
jgi:hypothetical protein